MKRVRRWLLGVVTVVCLPIRCSAEELRAPEVPIGAMQWMPEKPEQFIDAFVSVIRKLIPAFQSEIPAAFVTALAVYACVLIVSLLGQTESGYSPADLSGAVCVSALLLQQSQTMYSLAIRTVSEICEYEKLFLPIITTAAAGQGAVTSASALYIGISVFTAVLSNAVKRILFPGVYILLALSIACCAVGEQSLKQIKETIQKGIVWVLKTTLTVYLSCLSITGIVTGSVDRTTLKAARTTISTVVPIIGSSLAEASEALLSGAGIIKNAVGIYGVFAFMAMMMSPFCKIGVQYLVLKITAVLCSVIGTKRLSSLVNDFASAFGLLLAITGMISIFMMIGTISFMRIL